MSKAAQITPDGAVITVHNYKPVNVGDGDEMIQYPKSIWTLWTDTELNAIGYAKFTEDAVPRDKRSTGTIDTFSNGRVHRSHTLVDYVRPPVVDPTPMIPDQDAWTEEVPAVMGDDPDNPGTEIELTPATIIEHPATTKPNPEYDYVSLRQRDYEHTADEMIIALWEQVVEGRPEAAAVIETKRKVLKLKHPKGNL